jgi:hypothetical protein
VEERNKTAWAPWPYSGLLWEPHEFICSPGKDFHADMYVH